MSSESENENEKKNWGHVVNSQIRAVLRGEVTNTESITKAVERCLYCQSVDEGDSELCLPRAILNARRRHLNNAESHLEMGNLDATVQDLKMYFSI